MENEIILKPSGTIHIANEFTLIARKLINGLIWHAQQHGPLTADEHRIPMKEVFGIIGLPNSNNRDVIFQALDLLVGTKIRWNCLSLYPDDDNDEIGVCTFLASGKIRRGLVLYRLNPELVDKINHPTLFAKIRLLVQSQFKSRHSLALYEFFVDALCRNNTCSLTIPGTPLEIFLHMFNMQDTRYAFKDFRKNILNPCLREIREKASLYAEMETVKQGRQVVAITFHLEIHDDKAMEAIMGFFASNVLSEGQKRILEGIKGTDFQVAVCPSDTDPQLKNPSLIRSQSEAGESVDPVTKDIQHEGKESKRLDLALEDVIRRLVKLGVKQAVAETLVSQYPVERITANVSLTEERVTIGAIKRSVAGHAVSAIREDYASFKTPSQSTLLLNQEAAGSESVDKTSRKARKAHDPAVEDEWRRWCRERLRNKYEAMPEEWRMERQQKLLRSAEQRNHLCVLHDYELHGFRPGYTAFLELMDFCAPELLTEGEEKSLDAYLAWKASGTHSIEV